MIAEYLRSRKEKLNLQNIKRQYVHLPDILRLSSGILVTSSWLQDVGTLASQQVSKKKSAGVASEDHLKGCALYTSLPRGNKTAHSGF